MADSKQKLNLLENTTIAYAFLTFLEYSYINSYFSRWGIEIYSFLDVGDILLAFLKNINSLILLFVSLCIMFYAYIQFNSQTKVNTVSPRDSNLKKPLWKNLFIGGVELLVIGIIIYFLFKWNSTIMNSITNMLLFVVIIYTLNLILPKWLYNNNIALNKQYLKIILLILFIVKFNVFCAEIKYIKMTAFPKTNFSFTYECTNYKSSDSLIYIGATSKYFFLRNTKSKANQIFEKENIKNLSMIIE